MAGLLTTETRHPPLFRIPRHAHDLPSFYIVLEGGLVEYAGRTERELRPSGVVFTPAGDMTLPNSRLVVSYSTRYYTFLDQDVPAFLPDVRIDPSWPDFRAGRDPVMEWILRQSR